MTDQEKIAALEAEVARLQEELRHREADCYYSDANLTDCTDLLTEARSWAKEYKRRHTHVLAQFKAVRQAAIIKDKP